MPFTSVEISVQEEGTQEYFDMRIEDTARLTSRSLATHIDRVLGESDLTNKLPSALGHHRQHMRVEVSGEPQFVSLEDTISNYIHLGKVRLIINASAEYCVYCKNDVTTDKHTAHHSTDALDQPNTSNTYISNGEQDLIQRFIKSLPMNGTKLMGIRTEEKVSIGNIVSKLMNLTEQRVKGFYMLGSAISLIHGIRQCQWMTCVRRKRRMQ